MIRAIIFDFNGVIIDDEHVHFEAFRDALRDHGLELDEAEYYASYLGLNDRSSFRLAFREHRVAFDDARIEQEIDRKAEHYARLIERRLVLFPGVAELIPELARQVPLAIASGARRPEIARVLERTGLGQYFSAIVCADDIHEGKPDPAVFLAALERLRQSNDRNADILAGSCLVIEDAPNGVEAARRAGMRCIAVSTSASAVSLRGADAVVDSLLGLTLGELAALLSR